MRARAHLAVVVILALVLAPLPHLISAAADTQAPAAAKPDGSCGFCVLSPGDTSLVLVGSARLSSPTSNVMVNSSSGTAVALDGAAGISAPSVGVVGGVSTTGQAAIPNLTTGASPAADPLAGTPIPALPVPASPQSLTLTGTAQRAIFPGVYRDIVIKGAGALTLNPGTYVVTHDFSVTGQGTVQGRGVTIYLACSSYPNRCASGEQGASLELTGTGRFGLTAPNGICASGQLAIQADPNNTATISLAGTPRDTFAGTLYAPSATLSAVGVGTFAIGGQVVVGRATLNGTGTILVSSAGSLVSAPTLTLAPSTAGPDKIGSSQTLVATLTDAAGHPVANELVGLTVQGANTVATSAVTNDAGQAGFSYAGMRAGTDTATAFFGNGDRCLTSNTATVTWTAQPAPIATGPVTGNFFAEPAAAQAFTATPADTPLFAQKFPVVDFNPPSGTVPGNTSGVSPTTRPFTDVNTNVAGAFSGTVVAQGNGIQAGVGQAATFDAVLTSTFVVSSPGNVTFNVIADDGFILGVGGGATAVSGPSKNPPSTGLTPFFSYPVMAAFNAINGGPPATYAVTVNFPTAGTYPYELDYLSRSTQLSLVLTVAIISGQKPPLAIFTGYADTVRPPGTSTFPFPWQGANGVTFVGSPNPDGTWDTGGIRFDNTTSSPITLDHVTVDIGSSHFDPGWNNIVVPANGTAVLAASGQLTSGLPTGKGGIYVTGHDPDYHAFIGGNATGAQHILQRAVGWVTFGKTAPKMLLVTDLNNPGGDQSDPRFGLTAAGFTYDVADDGSSGQVLDVHTVDFTKYDVVVVASDYGGWLRQSELDILNARSTALISFVNNGGGLVALAECGCRGNGTGTTHDRYGYLPTIVSSAALNQSENGYTLTATGTSMGLTTSDINGNASHAIFTATGGLSIVDQDPAGHIISLTERGIQVGQSNFDTSDAGLGVPPPSNGTCCKATPFATDFPSSGVGPIGLAFDASGQLLVSDYTTGGFYRFGPSGGSASTALVSQALGGQAAGLAFTKDGRLYLARQSIGDVVEVDPATGAVKRAIATGLQNPTGLVTDPLSGDLFTSTSVNGGTVFRLTNFQNGPATVTVYSHISVDGMTFAPDGTMYAAGGTDKIYRIEATNSSTPGAVTQVASGVNTADGIAFITPPAGQPVTKLVVNRNDGIMTLVDLSTNPVTLTNVVTGGSRGDFVTVGPDGCLYATQTSSVEKVTFTDGSCPFVPTTPVCPTTTPTPQIHVTSNGQTTTFADTPKTLAAGGHDAECAGSSGANESLPWVQLNPGSPSINVPMPPTLTLVISPTSLPATVVGKPLSLTVNAVDSSGQAVSGLAVKLGISGANPQQLTATTDSAGATSFSYTGTGAGTDTITATALQGGALQVSNTVTTTWTIPLPAPPPTTAGAGAPAIFSVSPADQTTVSAATPISAIIQAPSGFTVAQWSVTSQLLPAGTPATLASASGVPPATLATFDPSGQSAGTYAITISATSSGGGNTTAVTRLIIAGAGAGGGAGGSAALASPSISQPSPPDGTLVTSPIPIQATFAPPAGQTIASWSVSYQALDPQPPVTLATGTGTPPATLATFDPTLLLNGTYAITVSATASGGGVQSLTTTVAVSGNLKLGRYTTTFQDLSVPVNGFQMEVRRTYDSTDKSTGDFGVGWRVSVANFRTAANRQLGAGGWSEYTTGCFILCSWAWKTSTPHYVTVTWPDGHQEVFDFTPTGPHLTLFDFANAATAFTARPGTNTTSTLQDAAGVVGLTPAGDGNLVDSTGNPYDPTQFLLTTRTGDKIALSTVSGLVSETDRSGNSVAIDAAGIHASNGQSVVYARDGAGRITSITDPNGHKLSYTYSAVGDLASFTDANGNVYAYSYDSNHDLLSTSGPGGGAPLEQDQFDATGRLISITDANGHTTAISQSVGTQQTTILDATGALTTVLSFDALGDVVQMDEIFGGTTLTSSASYDSVGRPLTRTDPAGHTWIGAYDAGGDATSLALPSGHNSNLTYDTKGALTSFTDALGGITSYAYDSAGNLTTFTDALGNASTLSYDSQGHLLSDTDALKRTTDYAYDSVGHQTSVVDARGFPTTYAYDANGHVLTTTNALGQATTNQYDGNGNYVSTTDPTNATIHYAYDALDRLVSKTDQAGKTTTYVYDPAGNLLSVTDPLGRVTSYSYDADSRLVTQTDPAGGITTSTYDGLGRLIASRDSLGRSTSYAYDASSRLSNETLPNGGGITFTYDSDGHQITVIDPLGRTSSSAYDAAGHLVSRTDPLHNSTAYTLDALGRQVQVTDAAGGITKYVFDAAGELTSVTDPLLRTTLYVYDADGNRASITDPLLNVTSFGYDGANRLTTTTDPLGNATTYSYDAAGRPIGTKLPSGSTTSRTYDPRGLLTSIADALGDTTSYGYDAAGQRVSQTDARGATTTFGYDLAGRQSSIADALGGVVHIAYDAAGQQTAVTNPRGDSTFYTYDSIGDVATQTNSAGGVTTNTYDLAGELVTRLDPRGITTTFSYDADGRQTAVGFPGGSIANAYDSLGRKTQMVDPSGTTTYTYDAASELLSTVAPAGTLSYTYDSDGRRASMTLPGSRSIQYAYDKASHLTQLTDWLSNKIGFAYTVDGLPSSESRPNGITTSVGYDAADRLVSLHHDSATGAVAHYDYTLDANGNRTSMTSGAGTESYTLDTLNRITKATYPNGDTVTYTYDSAGNRTSETINGVTANYAYNSAGELVGVGALSLSYDTAENLVQEGANSFTWDWNGRLASSSVGSLSSSYTYDGEGVRVGQTVGSTTTKYVVDLNAGLPTVVDDGSNAYVQADGLQAQISNSGTEQYALNDALGSVRQLADSSGAVAGSTGYDVFGGVRSQSGAGSTFGFTGEQTDPTGLVFLRARYLDSTTGRFLSPDQVVPNGPGTQGFNLFGYAAANPATLTDPSGRVTAVETGVRYAEIAPAAAEIEALTAEGPATAEEVAECTTVAAVEAVPGAPPVVDPKCPLVGPLIRWLIRIVIALTLAIVATAVTAQPAGEPSTEPEPLPQPQPTPEPPPSPTKDRGKRCSLTDAEVPAVEVALQAEAQSIHSLADRIRKGSQTVASLLARQPDGSCIDIIGASGSGLQPAQRTAVTALGAEIAYGSSGRHAEVTVLNSLGGRPPLVLGISIVGNDPAKGICDQTSKYQDSCRTDITLPVRGLSRGTILPDQKGAVWEGNLP